MTILEGLLMLLFGFLYGSIFTYFMFNRFHKW